MADLEWTRLHCPWDRRICFANRSDEGNQTNDAPISVTMMRLSLSLCLCARKMAHGSSLSAIKKTYKEYVCVHNAHYHRFEVTWFWNRLKRCFHRWQCFGMLSSVRTLYSLHLKVSVNHFFHILFSSSPPVQMRKKWNVHNSLGALSNYRFSFAHSLHSCSLLFTLSYRDLLTFFFQSFKYLSSDLSAFIWIWT